MKPSPIRVAAVAALAVMLSGCVGAPVTDATPTPGPAASASAPAAAGAGGSVPATPVGAADEVLRAELVAMLERDQAGRLDGVDSEGDQARTARLEEIVAAVGWPTIALVGEDGEDAAWAIAQHSDFDVAFQEEALAAMTSAGDGVSPGNIAYLEDRVAVNRGLPQLYGTQVGCVDGEVGPATRLRYPDDVDERRAGAGLEPLAEYYAQFAEGCAARG